MTKKSADINYISSDLFPKSYNRTMIDDEYIRQLENQNKKYKEVINKLKEYMYRSEVNSIGTPYAYTSRGEDILDILKEVNNE